MECISNQESPSTLLIFSWIADNVTSQPYGREWLTADNVLAQSAAMAGTLQTVGGFEYINVDSFWAADPTQVALIDVAAQMLLSSGR